MEDYRYADTMPKMNFYILLMGIQYLCLNFQLPSLAPDTFTMTGLTLLQQLFKMFDNSSNVKCNNPDAVYGIDQLWEIAVQAQSTEVSMDAISYLNSLYINGKYCTLLAVFLFLKL